MQKTVRIFKRKTREIEKKKIYILIENCKKRKRNRREKIFTKRKQIEKQEKI